MQDRVDQRREVILLQLATHDLGDRKSAVQRRADLVAHHRQEAALCGQGVLGILGEPTHVLGVGRRRGGRRLQQRERRAHAGTAAGAGHDEPLQQF
jgi:hypothetical protein